MAKPFQQSKVRLLTAHNWIVILFVECYFRTVSTENLKYLTVDQALADLAHFVKNITSDNGLNATGGVIVVGGSYSATMAAWFRQKYPHLVKGAWASSGPLRAKLNYFEYTETVGKSIRKVGGDECYYKLEDIFQAVDDLLTNDDSETLQQLFRLCDTFNITNQNDVFTFYSSLKNIFSGIVQGHRWILCLTILSTNVSRKFFRFQKRRNRSVLQGIK